MERTDARRPRVPYEWILGAMFVGSFALSWANSFVARGAWLVVVGPMAGLAFGVRRRDRPPKSGLLLPTAIVGLLWCATVFVLVEAKAHYGESRDAIEEAIEKLIRTWPHAALVGFTAQGLAAVKPGKYRESAVFANASFLLVLAWIVDLSLSLKVC